MRRLSLLLVCATLASCVSAPVPPDWNAPHAPAMHVTVIHDPLQEAARYEGPNCATNTNSLLFLRAVQDDADAPTALSYVIYVSDRYSGGAWMHYDRAADEQGQPLPLYVVNRTLAHCEPEACWYAEDFAIPVPKDYLLAHEGSGVQFQLTSARGASDYNLPGSYIRAFLAQLP